MLVMFMLALETEIDFQILTTLEAKGFLGLRQPFLWPGFVVLAILRRRKQFAWDFPVLKMSMKLKKLKTLKKLKMLKKLQMFRLNSWIRGNVVESEIQLTVM